MKRKGVSPIIATVLLIGMVIALALIVFVWMRALTKETITKFEDENIELACDKVKFEANYGIGQLSVLNSGSVSIYDIKVKVSNTGATITKSVRESSPNSWPRFGLNPGGAFLGDITGLDGDEVKLIPVLLGNSDTGKKTFTCDERVAYIL